MTKKKEKKKKQVHVKSCDLGLQDKLHKKRTDPFPGACWALQESAKGNQLSTGNFGFNNGAFQGVK